MKIHERQIHLMKDKFIWWRVMIGSSLLPMNTYAVNPSQISPGKKKEIKIKKNDCQVIILDAITKE